MVSCHLSNKVFLPAMDQGVPWVRPDDKILRINRIRNTQIYLSRNGSTIHQNMELDINCQMVQSAFI